MNCKLWTLFSSIWAGWHVVSRLIWNEDNVGQAFNTSSEVTEEFLVFFIILTNSFLEVSIWTMLIVKSVSDNKYETECIFEKNI